MTAGQSTIITASIYILGNTWELSFNDKNQFCHHTHYLSQIMSRWQHSNLAHRKKTGGNKVEGKGWLHL